MKNIRIHVGEGKPQSGWIHIKDFNELLMTLDTIKINDITTIHFSELDSDDFNILDCAYELISRANGKKLPSILIKSKNDEAFEALNYYTTTNKFNNLCIRT